MCGSIRNFTSAIAVAIYTATLNNRLEVTIASRVGPVATSLGLPEGSLPALYQAVQGLADYSTVQGLTPEIQRAVQNPWQEAFIAAASTVFLVSVAFSFSAVVLACFFQNNDKATMDFVASNVHGKTAQQKYNSDLKEEHRASATGVSNGQASNGIMTEKS